MKGLVGRIAGLGIAGTMAMSGSSYADPAIQGSIAVTKDSKGEWESLAKITLEEASQTALHTVQGKLDETELEEENGYLVYSIEVIDEKGQENEILIDAGTGKVLHTEIDD